MSRSAQARHCLLAFALAATAWLTTLGSYAHAHAQGKVHVVAPGETLAAIAKQHDVSVNALLRTNQLSDPNLIRAGQKLALPHEATTGADLGAADASIRVDEPTRVYIAKPGDTLPSIAAQFKTTTAKLAELNQRAPAAALHLGEPIRVPDRAGIAFEKQTGDDIPMPGSYHVHTVQPGESLAAIAATYGTSLRRTIELNRSLDAAAIKPGVKVIVPPPSFAELFADLPLGDDGYPEYPVIPTEGKWISVDLDHQRVWAWEGNQLVKDFWISSGKARTPTVTGVFRIWAKVPSQTMEGGSRAAGDYYNLPGVQWVQYFYQDYSFHAAYWHNNFGTPMSHGCVNMRTKDAQWLYEWTDPQFDDAKWHVLDAKQPGALVVVYQ